MANDENDSVFVATSLIDAIISSIAEAVCATNSESVSAMRETSSIDADISSTDVEVSSAFAESSSIDSRTLLIDWSICVTDADVRSVDSSCCADERANRNVIDAGFGEVPHVLQRDSSGRFQWNTSRHDFDCFAG